MDFKEKLDLVLGEVREMLLAKNASYGDTALNPINIMSQLSAEEGIRLRIDDKLSRLKNLRNLGENKFAQEEDTELDLIGYFIFKRINEIKEPSDKEQLNDYWEEYVKSIKEEDLLLKESDIKMPPYIAGTDPYKVLSNTNKAIVYRRRDGVPYPELIFDPVEVDIENGPCCSLKDILAGCEVRVVEMDISDPDSISQAIKEAFGGPPRLSVEDLLKR